MSHITEHQEQIENVFRHDASHLQQLVPDNHPPVPPGCSAGVDSHHEHAHAGAVSVPRQAEAQARLAFLQLDHVQDAGEVAIALDSFLCEGDGGQMSAD